jgi:hypothetical protein
MSRMSVVLVGLVGMVVDRMLQDHSQRGLRQHVGDRPIFDWQGLEDEHEFLGVAQSYLQVPIHHDQERRSVAMGSSFKVALSILLTRVRYRAIPKQDHHPEMLDFPY